MFNVELQQTHNKPDGYKTCVTMGTFRLHSTIISISFAQNKSLHNSIL
jgi:hypothetical protein